MHVTRSALLRSTMSLFALLATKDTLVATAPTAVDGWPALADPAGPRKRRKSGATPR